jgi:hypothetical protein
VEVANGTARPVALTVLELTDFTAGQRHVHAYRFPKTVDGGNLTLG